MPVVCTARAITVGQAMSSLWVVQVLRNTRDAGLVEHQNDVIDSSCYRVGPLALPADNAKPFWQQHPLGSGQSYWADLCQCSSPYQTFASPAFPSAFGDGHRCFFQFNASIFDSCCVIKERRELYRAHRRPDGPAPSMNPLFLRFVDALSSKIHTNISTIGAQMLGRVVALQEHPYHSMAL